ncbi:GTP cyclohydrolase I FolE2 [Serratia sp. JUb9]|uniref:GTP cyclohydrolase FolE2 n=1 Tax=unclassified Serratia (in: enterobacteria) TaxID=2647522 RepID=UPI000DA35DC1|nr:MULTISPECIES: GTP cyclohydrolase FolE2 [unclassified Serratia (in: enterobacteria)]QNK30539.1 GTP cyclohydrolase I FolE2 [Serratia sp. JUb9]QPT15589.1 GTP cyclohydrolase I FolE2 [Serratia rubidaea]CAE1145764.1 GTP cyclohydrolase FolE2 [Serratia sp. Tan611]SQJ20107.1 GTP cyclohydrolase folE2 [Serratia rubidaea]
MGNTAMAHRQPLPDVQSGHGEMSDIALDWVGMQGIALPLEVAGRPLNAEVSVGVNVCANRDGARGIHMSRLYLTLDALTQGELTPRRIINTLAECLQSQSTDSDRVQLEIGGELLLSRPALISPQRGWKSYPLRITAALELLPTLTLQVGVPYSSTCPASAALSRQAAQQQFLVDIEADDETVGTQQVADWLGTHGMPATPHSQRSWAWVTVTLSGDEKVLPVISLIDRIEHALGTPVQTLVKRQDEQAFALANGRNLMFCEDAARRLYDALRRSCCYRAFSVRVEHQESLHAHNAVARLSWREDADAA